MAFHRNRQGLRDGQTHSRRSIFPVRKTHPGRDSSGGADGAGDAGGRGQETPGPMGPPSQHVSRIMPHARQISLARISKVSPWQTGQRGDVMPAMVAAEAKSSTDRPGGRGRPAGETTNGPKPFRDSQRLPGAAPAAVAAVGLTAAAGAGLAGTHAALTAATAVARPTTGLRRGGGHRGQKERGPKQQGRHGKAP